MDFIIDFFTNNFSNCIWLAIILISMCPLLESKIAIPLAMNTLFWGSNAYSPYLACLLAFLGSILPCYFIMLIARKIKSKTTGFVTSKFFSKYSYKSTLLNQKTNNFKKYLSLACFVAVPLPLTGVWSGSLIAGLSNLNIHYAFLAILIGALISSLSITILCSIFSNSIMNILMISLIIIILFLIFDFILSIFKHKNKV